MRQRKVVALAAAAVLALGLAACGGGSDGGGGGGGDTFANATTLSITGVNTDASFATNGKFTVGFVAQDASGASILASASAGAQSIKVTMIGNWKNTSFKATTTDVTCSVSAPTSTTCTYQSISSTQPSSGSGGAVVGADLIDDTGSMSSSDPTRARATAAQAFLDSVCGCTSGASCTHTSNKFGAFDYYGGAGNQPAGYAASWVALRDLLTADSATIAGIPYPVCGDTTVTAGLTAITNQVSDNSDTPLYNAVTELCTDIVAKNAGFSPAIVLLSDGYPNADLPDEATAKAEAEACITNNNVLLCTVGLGPGSELDDYPDTDAVQVLKDLATTGHCAYAAATDASALTPIFAAIGTGASQGFNYAVFALDPIPTTGTTVTGILTVGTATATFTFLAP